MKTVNKINLRTSVNQTYGMQLSLHTHTKQIRKIYLRRAGQTAARVDVLPPSRSACGT